MKSGRLAFAACMAIAVALALGPALAQAPAGKAAEKPAPGPEHKKLAYFVGTWNTEGEAKPNPFMPGGTITSRDTCDWFEGGFAVVCHYDGKTPAGPSKGLGILGYSAEEKVYTYYGLDNGPMIMSSAARGTLENGSWVYNEETKMGGKPIKSRYTIKEASPSSYTFKYEMQKEDGSWLTLIEGKSTKG